MDSSIERLCAAVTNLRRITSEARLLLVGRPSSAEVKELQSLRLELVAELASYQYSVHDLIDASASDPALFDAMIELKVGAIALGQAYQKFRDLWLTRNFLCNWPEYRLSAQRMIQTIHHAIEPVDLVLGN